MKKLILAALLLTAAACHDQREEDFRRWIDFMNRTDSAYHRFHDITYNQAKYLMRDLVANDSLRGIATRSAISWYISKDTALAILKRNNELFSGMIFYLCYAENSNQEDSVFLAFKGLKEYDITNNSTDYLKTDDTLYLAAQPMVFSESADMTGVEHFMSGSGEAVSGRHELLKGDDIIRLSTRFVSRMRDPSSSQYNQKNFGFISKAELYSMADDKACFGLRVMLGYDGSEKINRIRIMVVPVDASGKLIIHHSGPIEWIDCIDRDWP